MDTYLAFVRPYRDGRDPAHDIHHIERILRRLEALSEGLEPPPRRRLLQFLACFHGLGSRVRDDAPFAHEVRSLLRNRGWIAIVERMYPIPNPNVTCAETAPGSWRAVVYGGRTRVRVDIAWDPSRQGFRVVGGPERER